MSCTKLLPLLACLLAGSFVAGPGFAQDPDTTAIIGFDDLEEEPPPAFRCL